MNSLEVKLAEKVKELELVLKETKSQLKELREKENSFKREIYYKYYYLNDCGETEIETDEDYPVDNFRYSIGNYFETKEEAENYKERLLIEQELKDIAMELNEDKKMFWSNNNLLSKYYLRYNFDDDRIITDCSYGSKIQGTIYCLDNNFKDVAIERIGEERLIKYLKGELD